LQLPSLRGIELVVSSPGPPTETAIIYTLYAALKERKKDCALNVSGLNVELSSNAFLNVLELWSDRNGKP